MSARTYGMKGVAVAGKAFHEKRVPFFRGSTET